MTYKDSTRKMVKAANAMVAKSERARIAKERIARLDKVVEKMDSQETKGKINPEED